MIEKGVSVVVPTKGRTNYVRELLLSLSIAKERSLVPVQFIIIDDSSEREAKIINTLCEEHATDYFYSPGGISDKRNFGISKAKFPIVLFVDSDCKVNANIFEEHLNCYRNNESIGGCVGITEFEGKKTIVSTIITEEMPFTPPHQFAKYLEYAPWGPCTNISFRRDLLNKVKGFFSFMPPEEGSEDVDLGYRIRELGYKIKCNPNAVVFHQREALRGWGGLVKRAFRWGRAEAYLLSHHRENSYIDIPKPTLIFGILFIVSIYESFSTHNLSLIFLPFLWFLFMLLIQGLLVFRQGPSKSSWNEIILSFTSILVDSIFELGMIIECLRQRKLSLLPRKYIYEEGQLHYRWYQGRIKIWSFVISLLILYLIIIIYLY